MFAYEKMKILSIFKLQDFQDGMRHQPNIGPQENVWKGSVNIWPIDRNRNRIYLLLHKNQILLNLLQGVDPPLDNFSLW